MIVVDVLKILWPFFKEMIIGKNSFRYALKKNRVRVIFFALVIISFGVNWFTVPKLITISASHVELSRQMKQCTQATTHLEATRQQYNLDQSLIASLQQENLKLKEEVETLKTTPVAEPNPGSRHPNKPPRQVQPVLPPGRNADSADRVRDRLRIN